MTVTDMVIASVLWGLIFVSLAARFFREDRSPWSEVDHLFFKVFGWAWSGVLRLPEVDKNQWDSSYSGRIGLVRQLPLGLALLLIFPYHNLAKTDLVIDQLWKLVDWLRSVTPMMPSVKFVATNSWRSKEYELWEVCVVVWTIGFFLELAFQERVRLQGNIKIVNAEELGRFAAQLGYFRRLQDVILLLGIILLILLDNPVYRLSFELFVVVLLTALDTYHTRRYVRVNQIKAAKRQAELIGLADLPALFAFVCLMLFALLQGDVSGSWMAAFVSGASALNLLFASIVTLIIKVAQAFREEASIPQRDSGTEGVV